MRCLGLRLNLKKSVLSPSQRTNFLGVAWYSTTMQAHLSPACVDSNLTAIKGIRLGQESQRLLGLMDLIGSTAHSSSGLRFSLSFLRRRLRTLQLLRRPWFLNQCPTLRACCCSKTLMTDASLMGWGAVFDGCPARGLWKDPHISWHINCLKMRAVFLALKHFSRN